MVDRIAVHGASGSGKTRLATILATGLGLPHTELDAVFHQPGWTPLDTATFRRRVGDLVAGDRWVVDGNYRAVRDLVWSRAELIVVLAFPRSVVMRQLAGRSVVRAAMHRELWNGNRESFRNLLSTDADRNVVLWSWRTADRYLREVPAEARTEAPHAGLVVLRSRREVEAFVRSTVGRRR